MNTLIAVLLSFDAGIITPIVYELSVSIDHGFGRREHKVEKFVTKAQCERHVDLYNKYYGIKVLSECVKTFVDEDEFKKAIANTI